MHFEWWETGPINIRGLIAWSMYMVRLVSDIVHLLCLGGVRLGHCTSSDMVIVLGLDGVRYVHFTVFGWCQTWSLYIVWVVSDVVLILGLGGVRHGHCILFGWCQI